MNPQITMKSNHRGGKNPENRSLDPIDFTDHLDGADATKDGEQK